MVGSTKVLLNAVIDLPDEQFIVATDYGIFYKMQQMAPNKRLMIAPTGSKDKQCHSCAHCPWMAMNGLQNLADCLEQQSGEIRIDADIQKRALKSLDRMLTFSREHGLIPANSK